MIELTDELLTFEEAAAQLRIGGREQRSAACIRKWATHGAYGLNKKRIYLEVLRVGSTTVTTMKALEEFVKALSNRTATGSETTAQV